MGKILNYLNILLGLTLMLLIGLGVKTWIQPAFSARINGESIIPSPKTVEPLSFNRKPYSAEVINSAIQGNVFRQERAEFSPPVQVAVAPPKPALPPPDLQLKGIMLYGNMKMAILEGDYPTMEENNAIRKTPLKRKGYKLGEQIGGYELTSIGKSEVTLYDRSGRILNLKLAERPPDKAIRRDGTRLIQKSKNYDPANIRVAPPPPRPVAAPSPPSPTGQPVGTAPASPSIRISGAPTGLPEGIPQPRISGR